MSRGCETTRIAIVLAFCAGLGGCTASQQAVRMQHYSDPVWNVWTERSSVPAFKPENLQRGQDYSIVVNLAAMKYRLTQGTQVYSQDASAPFAEWLLRHPDLDAADLDVLVVPDRRYMEMLDGGMKVLSLDLKKLRHARETGFTFERSPFEHLRSHQGQAPFSFGTVTFRTRVLPTAPLGSAPVALSFWADGKPIDEVAVNLCVASSATAECRVSAASEEYTLRGADLAGTGRPPDAALHVIERGTDVVGVFRCDNCGHNRYFAWTVAREAPGWLSDRVNELVQRLTPPVANQERFLQEGEALHNLLFPHSDDADIAAADRAFSGFVAGSRPAAATATPASLFVRVLAKRPTLLLFPMALMRVPLPDGSKAFVGFSVNVEAPLELQDYSVQSSCISDWVVFAPPPGESLGEVSTARAYANAEGWIDSVARSCGECSFSEPERFVDFLLGNTRPGRPAASEALVVLSQYGNNRLFFDGAAENPPSVPSASIRRRFTLPSFAMLDACGTAAPGGSEFMRSLNQHGVTSIVSTSTAITGSLGGRFLQIFMALVRDHPDYTVSRARYEAVKILSDKEESKGRKYGAQALVFALVGNGRLRLCSPAAEGSGAG